MPMRGRSRLLLAVLMLAACAGTTTTSTTTAAGPTTTAAPTTVFAFMKRVSTEEIVVDHAQFLTGQEAIDAAVEDGVTTPEEGVPNDYYIRNPDAQLRTLPLSVDVVVILATPAAGAVGEVRVTLAEWLRLFHDDGTPYDLSTEQPPPVSEPHNGFFGAGWGAPYWLTIEGDQVSQIRQQYLP